jgi:hypothetical protein
LLVLVVLASLALLVAATGAGASGGGHRCSGFKLASHTGVSHIRARHLTCPYAKKIIKRSSQTGSYRHYQCGGHTNGPDSFREHCTNYPKRVGWTEKLVEP